MLVRVLVLVLVLVLGGMRSSFADWERIGRCTCEKHMPQH